MRFFSTAGPVRPAEHYHIPPLSRIGLDEVLGLVRDRKYFVVHAPRQTGKTTALLALADLLNERGYHCVYVTVETAGTTRNDVARAMRVVLTALAEAAEETLGDRFLGSVRAEILADSGPDLALLASLRLWAQAAPRPLVLLIDEIDALTGDSLLSALRQLRAGFRERPERFPQSVVLCGLQDVRVNRIDPDGTPFNVSAASLRLSDFSRDDTFALLGQHTAETGQPFTSEALDAVWTQTRGQPWLVNALAYGACFENKALCADRSSPVTAADVAAVRADLIVSRVIHLDYLAYMLSDERVRRVVEPLLTGSESRAEAHDIEYTRALGLIARDAPVRIANPIYAEMVRRELASVSSAG